MSRRFLFFLKWFLPSALCCERLFARCQLGVLVSSLPPLTRLTWTQKKPRSGPWGVACFSGAISEPAWRTKPSWYLVAAEDKRIPPDAQRAMAKRAGSTVVEAKGSHAIYFSQPKAVAALIEQAASKNKGAAVA